MSKKAVLASVTPKLSPSFTVPLSALCIAEDTNVRNPKGVSVEGIQQMAAMLASQGQINPLVVSKSSESDRYTVHAGGRRLRGFWHLRQAGQIQSDFQVHVREVDPLVAVDISLVENLSQEPMHPVDEFRAFERLSANGQSPEQIAKAVGCKVLHVKRRLKLAAVAPCLLEEFRSGDINLDQIMALAGCEDQERQVQIWTALPEWARGDQQIRRKLSEDEVSIDDDRLKLVSIDAYLAAGGAVRQDLFTDDGEVQFLTDPGLLDLMVAEKLEAFAQEVRTAGWAWVDVLPSFGHASRQAYAQYPTVMLAESDDQRLRREALEAKATDLEERIDALDESEADDAMAQSERLREETYVVDAQIEAIEEERIDLSAIDMRIAGAVVCLEGGQIACKKPLVRKDDLKQLKAIHESRQAATTTDGHSGPDVEAESVAPVEVISERLLVNLTAQRTAAIQASLLQNAPVALAGLAACMASRVFRPGYFDSAMKVSLTLQAHTLEQSCPTLTSSSAFLALTEAQAFWSSRLPQDCTAFFGWFLAQPLEVSVEMIAYCSSLTVNAIQNRPDARDTAKDFADALKLNMAQWWSPSEDNYLALVPKAKMMDAVTEAKGQSAAHGMEKMKKAEAIAHAAVALKDSGWLPSSLR